MREAALKDFPAAWLTCKEEGPAKDKVRAVKIIERDDDAEHGGEWSHLVNRTGKR